VLAAQQVVEGEPRGAGPTADCAVTGDFLVVWQIDRRKDSLNLGWGAVRASLIEHGFD
jgi:hypothetical protein